MWTRRLSEIACLAAIAGAPLRASAAPPTWTVDPAVDPYAGYREPFKLGLERYRAGAVAEAIGHWEPIYRELGEEKGYRLAYDLGVAYQELGDATRAAERLQAFLAEFQARDLRGEPAEPMVVKEEADARARVARLVATKGRIRIAASTPPRTARVDASEPRVAGFVAWVTPGEHKVTFGAGT
ncbi:MAG: hypothetical protein JOZ69_20285, partial [Myxococcales bacterium]|nr:hypothetical protein [Myxococcales bacterium]